VSIREDWAEFSKEHKWGRDLVAEADEIKKTSTPEQDHALVENIIIKTQGFVSGNFSEGDSAPVQKFRDLLKLYDGIDKKKLQENMKYWLEAIMPICDEYDINMCVHPDDPPYPVFGLPRIIGRAEDIQWMLDAVPNKHNGLTFCAGSFSAGEHNDCVAMAKQFADRTHFVHLRSCYIFTNGNFTEASHLGGRGHLIELCRIFEKAEQEGKCNSGRRLPMRVDHGMTFTDEPGGVFDESNHGHNAGYTLLGRMFAMGQIQGVIATVDDELGIEYKQPGFYD
jgi:mannonate dehydratase